MYFDSLLQKVQSIYFWSYMLWTEHHSNRNAQQRFYFSQWTENRETGGNRDKVPLKTLLFNYFFQFGTLEVSSQTLLGSQDGALTVKASSDDSRVLSTTSQECAERQLIASFPANSPSLYKVLFKTPSKGQLKSPLSWHNSSLGRELQ